MPPAPKSGSSKKAGAPKGKGAVRAKSGCYTCRIRRKKCDEKADANNHCQTCTRLRLQCLGFGAKRPEWLRENRNVSVLREKIKKFLAAQGMIKGHSGSGPRSADGEPHILVLEEYSSSESPQTVHSPLLEDVGRTHHSGRGNYDSYYPHADTDSASPPSSHDGDGAHISFSHNQYSQSQESSTIVSFNTLPTFYSSFSPHYHYSSEDYMLEDPLDVAYEQQGTTSDPIHIGLSANDWWRGDQHVHHYMGNVVRIQYLLANESVAQLIFQAISQHPPSLKAVCMLAEIHMHRRSTSTLAYRQPAFPLDELLRELKIELANAETADDAMAALHVISTFLFDGGKGSWEEWLPIACAFVRRILYNPSCHGPADALLGANSKIAFIIKTTIWFDVLASVTRQTEPELLDCVRAMFNPMRSGVEAAVPLHHDDKYSMMSPMGCENHVVWALAETSALAAWKHAEASKGCLSIPVLVERSRAIDACLEYSTFSAFPTLLPENELHASRLLASEIFRTSTRLYLRSVVSGDFPRVLDITGAVKDVMDSIHRIPIERGNSNIPRDVVRSTVFGFFICGALSSTPAQRNIITTRLVQRHGDNVGNTSAVQQLLQDIWDRSAIAPTRPVPWQQVLREHKTLLV